MRQGYTFGEKVERRKTRKPYNTPGVAQELTFTCHRRLHLLKSETACKWLAEAIDAARVEHNFALIAYVFMPNHAHLLILPRDREYDVGAIRKSIKQPVAQKAIASLRQRRSDMLEKLKTVSGKRVIYRFWLDGGGYDRNLFTPEAIAASIRYIHANPVKKMLVELESDWKWSSAAAHAGLDHGPLRIDLEELA